MFIFFGEKHFWSFLLNCLCLQENRPLIIPNSINNWYRKIVKEVMINTFYLKLQLLPATSLDSGEFTFQQDCRSTQNMLFYDINISQDSVATRLRWGGIFSNCRIASFLENVPVKEFWKSASIMCWLRRLTFLAHPVLVGYWMSYIVRSCYGS